MTELESQLYRNYKESIIEWLDNNPEYIDEAINLAISDKPNFAWRAAWLLSSALNYNDKKIRNYQSEIINALKNKKDGHKRELIKLLMNIDIDEEFEGELFDICVSLWEKTTAQPSIRIIAFRMIMKIANRHQELMNEIPFLLQEHLIDSLSPGIRHSLKRIINEKKLNTFLD
ncbi:hypothetical protein MASR1M45_19660 [Candidatus Kapaibacterium sp.]